MSRSFISNMKSYIEPEALPNRAKRFGEQLGIIVRHVTTPQGESPKPPLRCWNKIKRKACKGKIDAGIDLTNFAILWHCLECGDHGSISNWQQSIWDGNCR